MKSIANITFIIYRKYFSLIFAASLHALCAYGIVDRHQTNDILRTLMYIFVLI